ncbi:MAG: neocarzinostatin apoprotein domain-containing protein [Acidimicrobiia bacterium]
MIRRIGLALLAVATVLAGTATAGAAATAPPTTSPAPSSTAPGPAAPAPTERDATWNRAVRDATAGRTSPVGAGPAATANPTLSVDPDTDLRRGQQVAVSGTGYSAGMVTVLQCVAGTTSAIDCDLSDLVFFNPAADGTISTTVTVHRVIDGPTGPVDCGSAAGTCELVSADQSATVLARHPISFDPSEPPPTVAMTVTPAEGLLAGQTITVDGSGFLAGGLVLVRECAADAPFCSGPAAYPTADGTGAFEAQLTVGLRVTDATGATTNCLVVACVVRAESLSDGEYSAESPITFDPSQPPPPVPAITVEPATGLLHDQQVTISGTGFDPSTSVELTECGNSTDVFCSEFLAVAQSDGSGAFSTTATVSRLVSEFTPGGSSIEDCADVGCSVSAVGFGSVDPVELVARAAIAFDASVPPPDRPTATVTPDTNLPYRTDVAVHGSGFRPGESVYAIYCVDSLQEGSCGAFSAQGTADDTGTVDLTLTVKRRVASDSDNGSVVDCVDPDTSCSVQIQGERGYEQIQLPVTFDPDAPIPPPPVAAIGVDHPLGWREVVTVLGGGFTPGPIGLSQCARVTSGDTSFESCGNYSQAQVDATGILLTTARLDRMLDLGFGTPVDCATAPTPCTLRIGYGDPDDSATIPLTFDPSSQPPPPPVLTILPAGPLLDGRPAILLGSGFTPGATLGLSECAAGATSIADSCDLGHAFTATADADGAFATAFVPVGAGGSSQGTLDCTVAPGTCVLAAANTSDLREFTSTPLTFDAPELAVHGTTITEGTGDMPTMADVMVELSEPIGTDTTVAWHTAPGTAGPDDFGVHHGRVTIPAGATEAMIPVEVTADAMDEPTERFTVVVDAAAGTIPAAPSATVKISDDDAGPVASVADGRGREARGRAHAVVTLSAPSGRTVVVEYVTHHGTARSGSDYVRTKGDLVFAPGETSATIRIPLVDDHTAEPSESFTVELYDTTNASIGRAVGTVTIRDDD